VSVPVNHRPLRKVLVANRGEIACRVLRTLREMGIASVAVYSDADANAPCVRLADEAVRIGPAAASESYLDVARILEAARATGADAVHPGYGFLSENAEFAAACAQAGLVFIGPPVDAIRRMGSKVEAKALMEAAGVPVLGGFATAGLSDAEIAKRGAALGYPLLVKASAGGGGKGMRVVHEASALAAALGSARREAKSAFGDDALLIERWVEAARHVEVQIFGDAHGGLVHLFERDCSLQRRHQKVIEEAPAPGLDPALRSRLCAAAVAAGKAIGYVGAGTVEFLLDGEGRFHFLEVNTRLQVEHPVTEAITGLDLVRLQLEVAEGRALALEQADVFADGHAIEARLYAEDPAQGFLPATGRLALWVLPELPDLRIDAGVESGSTIGVHYDPLLAKLVAHAPTRDGARRRLASALRELAVAGVVTNREFLIAALEHPAFAAGGVETRFFERHGVRAAAPEPRTARLHALAAALWDHERRREAPGPLPASVPSGFRNNRWRPQSQSYTLGDRGIEVRYVAQPDGRFDVELVEAGESSAHTAQLCERGALELVIEIDRVRRRFLVADAGERSCVHGAGGTSELLRVPRFPEAARADVTGGFAAPMTGIVREVKVATGDRVAPGDVLLVLEAMKMEHPLVARAPGTVREVRVVAGQMVDPDEILIVVDADEPEGAKEPA
jgi:acetyl/propionyl-CoA carboxylase alpha subunit